MKYLRQKVLPYAFHPAGYPIFLLGLCLLAYGLLVTRLGLYWDDFPINWIASTMGGEGLERYFSTNRPVWGLIYRVTTPVLGSAPLPWQIFGILMRWLTGLALWALLRQTWPERGAFAAWAAALFVLYPGFNQQSTAFMYSHFYIVLASFLLSLLLMVAALRNRAWYWPLTAAGGLLSLLNMLAMEYFFLLDLLRPALIWIVLRQEMPAQRASERLRRALLHWLPYLALFAGAVFWRSVLFGFQTYQPTLINRLRSDPLPALWDLAQVALLDLVKTTFLAWARPFRLPEQSELGRLYFLVYWLLVAVSAAACSVYLAGYAHAERGEAGKRLNRWALEPVGLGLLALLLAGGPFWLTDLPVGLTFPNDRFTLSFMLGASLLMAGLLALLPLPRWSAAAVLAVALGMAVGLQFQNAVSYNRAWSMQRAMFWQLVWRAPDIAPGTLLFINETPMQYYSDNSLSAPLNWIYDPHVQPPEMQYMFFYPTLRRETALRYLEPGQPVEQDYLALAFHGSTDRALTVYYQPPGCLRVLDPEIESANWMVPSYLRDTLRVSTLEPIRSAPPPGKPQPVPPAQIFGAEIARGWCYYYEKADLARQFGDWERVAQLGEAAFATGDYPNDPAERLPFIEGYAHTGQWERASQLSRETRAITPAMQPVLCRLWQRIARETGQPAPAAAMQAELACESQ